MEFSDSFLHGADLDRIIDALGPAAAVAYAPPNIYPMSAPKFRSDPKARRQPAVGNELGIYIHIPYCHYSCTFCFYATRLAPSQAEMQRYVRALQAELAWVEPGTRLTQLYCGGGTPTALPPMLLAEVLTAVFDRAQPRGDDVHTVECSPESLTSAHVDVFLKFSIKRISMGVQSLQGRVLETVKREHATEQVFESLRLLVSAGLMVNVDLIYGLPGQSEQSFCDDFSALAAAGAHSITAYNLRVNERTPVGRSLGADERLDLRRLVRWRSVIRRHAARLGFRPKRWHTFERSDPSTAAPIVARFRDITGQGEQFGAGVSARSRLNHTVYRNHTRYDEYLERVENAESPVEEAFSLSAEDRRIRFVALSLGDGQPLRRDDYAQAFECEVEADYGELLDALRDIGVIHDNGREITLSSEGQLIYDLVTRAFYPQHIRHWLDERQKLAQTKANLRAVVRSSA